MELQNVSKMTTFAKQARKKWFSRAANLKMKAVIIIGKCHDTAGDNVFHCIARARINGQYFLFSPDTPGRKPSTEEELRLFFASIAVIYKIVRRNGPVAQNNAFDNALY